jgi:hypothetical protein
MKTIFAPLTDAVVLATIVSMAGYPKNHTLAGSMLPGTSVHAVARQWGKLDSVPLNVTVDVLSGAVHGVAALARATDGDPHVTGFIPCLKAWAFSGNSVVH